jgi:hypothetical protein
MKARRQDKHHKKCKAQYEDKKTMMNTQGLEQKQAQLPTRRQEKMTTMVNIG